jgi:type I restriction enzyme, S subunit
VSIAWPRKKISEVANHSLGKMLDRSKNKGELKPYLRNQNVRWFDFDLSDLSQMRFLSAEKEKYTVLKGDVLVCEGGYPGRAAIWDKDEPIHFQKALHRVRFHEPERNKWFLYYLLSKDLDGTLRKHFNGAGIQHFTGEALAQFELPVPPLAEQKRIVGILDEAFEGITTAKGNAEQNLRNARALFESHLSAVFSRQGKGWADRSLVSLCSTFIDSPHRTPKYESHGIPALRPRDIVNGTLTLATAARVSTEEYEIQSKRYRPQGGDVVYSRELSFGWAALIPDNVRVCLSQGMCVFRPTAEIDAKLLVYLLNGPIGREQAIRVAVGAAHPHINLGDIKAYKLPVPPIGEQAGIVRELDAISGDSRRLESLYQKKLDALDVLKSALLHQAFTGQL